MIDEDTITERELVLGRFAFLAANDAVSQHRTVRVYDLSNSEKQLPDNSSLRGEFVKSFYLSALLRFALSADARDGLPLRGSLAVPAEDWAALEVWLRVMAR